MKIEVKYVGIGAISVPVQASNTRITQADTCLQSTDSRQGKSITIAVYQSGSDLKFDIPVMHHASSFCHCYMQ